MTTPTRTALAAALVLVSCAARAQQLHVFARATDGHVLRATAPGAWERLAAQAVGAPDAAHGGVAVRGTDDALWWVPLAGAPERVESVLRSGPGAAAHPRAGLAVAAIGSDGGAWLVVRTSAEWGAWEALGGRFVDGAAPDLAWSSDGALHVVARGTDGAAWRGTRGGDGAWSGWSPTGEAVAGDPAIVAVEGTAPVLVRIGPDRQAHFGGTALGGAFDAGTGIDACADGAGGVVVVARGQDAAAWVNRRAGGAWSGWSSWGGMLDGDPTCAFDSVAEGGASAPKPGRANGGGARDSWSDPAALDAALDRWSEPIGSDALKALPALRAMMPAVELDAQALAAHVVRPKDAGRVIHETVEPLHVPAEVLRAERVMTLDLDAYRRGATSALAGAAGYYLELRQGGETVLTLQGGSARRSLGSSGGLDWNGSRRMHVASVSKAVTAMAMTRLLEQRGISLDDRIAAYLPDAWARGPGVDLVTFRQLLTHRSGLRTPSRFAGGDSSYPAMRATIAAGSSGTGTPDYQNVNFGLCRVLMPIIAGTSSRELAFGTLPLIPVLSDAVWDAVSVQLYVQQVRASVFAPAGVSGPTISLVTDDAIAETLPPTGGGWESDLPTGLEYMTGTVGWHFSAQELLAVMREFRRGGSIVSPESADRMLAAGIGMDALTRTPAGLIATKSGYWEVPSRGCEQAIASFLPNDMELVVLVNSRLTPTGGALMATMDALFASSLR